VVVPLVSILGIFTAVEYRRDQTAILAELSQIASYSGKVIENNLRHEMQESDFVGVQELLDTLGETGQFSILYVMDLSGRVIFSPDKTATGTLLDNRAPDCQPCHHLPPEVRPASVIVEADNGEQVFRTMLPIENGPACSNCHDPRERLLGLVLTDIPTAPLTEPIAANLRENLLWWLGTILATVIIVNIVMSQLVIGRLQRVAQTLAQFGRGQLDLRLEADSPDEIGQLALAFNEMGQNIENEEARNRALSTDVRRHAARQRELLKRLITAQEEERQKVSRDLHDGLGQDLAGLAVDLQGVESLWISSPESVRQQLVKIHERIGDMTDRTYDMILTLRPSALDDLGLLPALRAHAERKLKESGTRFEIEARDLPRRLPPEVETTVFRVLQEAISNVVRHAGANYVRTSLGVRNGNLEGEVVDNGCGFDPRTVPTHGSGPRGLGLLGMQERLALFGGTLKIVSRPGDGTRLHIRIPLTETSSA
jgi:signal transduction histidine kinase